MIKPLEIVGESPPYCLRNGNNADINNLDERMKNTMEEAALELENLIEALNLGFDV